MNFSTYEMNRIIDGMFRGGAITSSGTAGSTAVCNKGVWAQSTVYSVGDLVVPGASMTGAGGKFLRCSTAGTSGTNAALALTNPGTTITDGTAVWTVVAGAPAHSMLYAALLTINKGLRANSTAYASGDVISLTAQGGVNGDNNQHLYKCTTAGTSAAAQPQYNGVDGEVVTDGTAVFTELSATIKSNTGFPSGLAEVSGGSYARVALSGNAVLQLADLAGTQAAGSTTSSTGSSNQTSNNNAVSFASPTANWGIVGAVAIYDALSAGNLIWFAPFTTPATVNSGATAPSIGAGSLTLTTDN